MTAQDHIQTTQVQGFTFSMMVEKPPPIISPMGVGYTASVRFTCSGLSGLKRTDTGVPYVRSTLYRLTNLTFKDKLDTALPSAASKVKRDTAPPSATSLHLTRTISSL